MMTSSSSPTVISFFESEELMEKYPTADRQQLRNLQRQAAREVELKKAPTASKKIFAYLRQLSE